MMLLQALHDGVVATLQFYQAISHKQYKRAPKLL